MSQRINQRTLSNIIKKRAKITALENELAEMEQAVELALKDGASCSKGTFTAYIKEWTKRNVAWKSIVVREIDKIRGAGEGEKFCEHVLAATTPEPYSKLVVEIAK